MLYCTLLVQQCRVWCCTLLVQQCHWSSVHSILQVLVLSFPCRLWKKIDVSFVVYGEFVLVWLRHLVMSKSSPLNVWQCHCIVHPMTGCHGCAAGSWLASRARWAPRAHPHESMTMTHWHNHTRLPWHCHCHGQVGWNLMGSVLSMFCCPLIALCDTYNKI